jgi:hypothetical protein
MFHSHRPFCGSTPSYSEFTITLKNIWKKHLIEKRALSQTVNHRLLNERFDKSSCVRLPGGIIDLVGKVCATHEKG